MIEILLQIIPTPPVGTDPRPLYYAAGIVAASILWIWADRKGLLKNFGRNAKDSVVDEEGVELSSEPHTVLLHDRDRRENVYLKRWEPGTVDSAGNETGTVVDENGVEIPVRTEHLRNVTTIPQALRGDVHLEYSRKGFGSRLEQELISIKKDLSSYIDENTALKNRLKNKSIDIETQLQQEYESEGTKRRGVNLKGGWTHFDKRQKGGDDGDQQDE